MKYLLLLFMLGLSLLGTTQVYAQEDTSFCPEGSGDLVCLKNPLDFDPQHTFNDPRALVYKAFLGFMAIMGVLAIAFTVYSGFKLTVATNEEAIKTAQQSLKWAIGGYVVALLSYTIIAGAARFIGFNPQKVEENGEIGNPIDLGGDKDKSGDFVAVAEFVMLNFLVLIGVASTLMIIYYGYRYMTAAGNEEVTESAKQGIKWAVVGVAVSLLAYTIVNSLQKYAISGL